MTTDRYTQAVLTVIAAALVTIAAQNATSPARALGEGCGSAKFDRCYVEVVGPVETWSR